MATFLNTIPEISTRSWSREFVLKECRSGMRLENDTKNNLAENYEFNKSRLTSSN